MDVTELISKLSLTEKALLLSGKNNWETRDMPRLNLPAYFFADGPHGIRKQEGKSDHLGLNKSRAATCFPTAATVANSWDEQLAEQIGSALGEEAKAQQVDVLLGPGLNIKRHPLGGRNFEYFSEDPYLSGKMAAAYVRGIQHSGTIACPKHFAANSQETRRMASDSIIDERTLRELYLTAFEIVVKEAKPKSIMSAYNQLNGIYANESRFLLRDILRAEWNFDGFVVSDWGGSNDHVAGVINGSHLEMPSTGAAGAAELIQAVENGNLHESIIDERLQELLSVLLAKPKQSSEQTLSEHKTSEHHDLACRAALESAVLLKNQDHILPLRSGVKIAIIGAFAEEPRYQGAGSSFVNPTRLDRTTEIIDQYDLNYIGFAQGYDTKNTISKDQFVQEAVSLARQAEVVLYYFGLDESSESEGMDRIHFTLPPNQLELLQELKKSKFEYRRHPFRRFSSGFVF
ncbi:thermostable beta-glucosidase B [Listeria floridensis FSL S10-1187]|uniref:Thermostable beta-glucosidase B n=1 Tax=Listeria floridensis FSL S10-1187 TaxID=1265817 RepID=A0ABP3AW99_9LIST|nr:glycoside hydrolase family 3 protein [Listeria floridensis]EUJ29130.1 thermostable beta-glucosidase B [Listeria floridensis FSL S10-1187]